MKLPPGTRLLVGVLMLVPALAGFDPVRSRSRAIEEGNMKMKAGKAEEALAAYDKAAAELPLDPAVHFDRGTALAALSRFDEAGEEFLRATEAREAALKSAAFYNLANAFFKKDKFKEAIEAYKRTLALTPGDERAKWNLEIALKKKRDDDKKKEQDKDQKNKDDKQKDKQDKKNDKQDDKQDDKKDQDQKDKQQQDKDQAKKDAEKPKQEPQEQPRQDKAEEKPPAQREMESVLDSLEKSPKDLETQRARLRAVRRAPPTRDW